MTDDDLQRLPQAFLVAIARDAFGYCNARNTAAGPGHYRALRASVQYARQWLRMDEDERVGDPVQADEVVTHQDMAA